MPPRSRATRTGLRSPTHPNYAAQTIDRGLTILQCFTPTSPSLSAQEIAKQLAMPHSTLFRYLATLEANGYLDRDPRSGLYRLGLRLVEHAGIVLNQLDVRVHALPELDALADEVGLNGNLAVLFDGETFHIGYAIRSQVPRMYTTLGRRAVAHCTALGKCLLAWLPREEVHALIEEKGWHPYTPKSIQSFERLDQELDDIVERGYALDREERHPGHWCAAAPIRDRTGQVVAAMSASGSMQAFDGPNLGHIVEKVIEHADRVSYRMGHEPLLTMGL